MTRLTQHRSYDAPRQLVWDVITDPDLYAEVAPNLSAVTVIDGDGEGMVRECVDTDGNTWRETCTDWEEEHGFAVAVETATSDFHRRLFTRFEGEWRLSETDEAVIVTIRFTFDTRYGPLGWFLARYFEYRAPSLIEAIFDGWDAEIQRRLADPTRSPDSKRPSKTATPTNRLYR